MASGVGTTSSTEIRDIIIADVVLIIAFSLTFMGGITAFQSNSSNSVAMFGYYASIAAIGVTLSFVLHELMHKFFAQKYGAIAEFRTSFSGLAVTLITGAFGFLLGIPGATMIYTSAFTRRENGIVSIAGPLTNLAVFAAFLIFSLLASPAQGSYLAAVVHFTIFISILLAFFNMLPIHPLDGSKVLQWNKQAYFISMAAIFILMVMFGGIGIFNVIILIVIALIFSLIYRFVL